MNVVVIQPQSPDSRRATAGAWDLGGGAVLAFVAEGPEGADRLRDFLAGERERLAGLLAGLTAEQVPFLLADLLNRAYRQAGETPAPILLSIYKDGSLAVLPAGGGAVYLAPAGGGPVWRVGEGGAVSLLLSDSQPLSAAFPAAAPRQVLASEVVRLPVTGETLVTLVSGSAEAPVRERLLAAVQTARGPEALEAVLRGPVERAGGALLAFAASGASHETSSAQAEIAGMRRDLERRLVRLESRLDELEEMSTVLAAGRPSPRLGFFSLTRAVPRPQPLPRRPLGETPTGPDEDSPQFEQGLDVPTASNWSRPLLVVTGGITLFLFLLLQLFCPASPPRPRRLPPRSTVVPVGQPPKAAAPASKPAPPSGTLFVTPTNEPEGTEPATPPS